MTKELEMKYCPSCACEQLCRKLTDIKFECETCGNIFDIWESESEQDTSEEEEFDS